MDTGRAQGDLIRGMKAPGDSVGNWHCRRDVGSSLGYSVIMRSDVCGYGEGASDL